MEYTLNKNFLQCVNENIAIAHKVVRIYFPDMHEREDAIQEIMFQLWRSYPRFDGRSKFSTWMYTVCLNTALTLIRNNKKRRENTSLLPEHYEIPQDQGNNKEDIHLLLEGISTLSPLNKAIILGYLENMSYEEIATVTGLSKSNVSVRLVRIKKELENFLNNRNKTINHVNP